MEKLNLSSPWVNFYREIEALFSEDPEIKVAFDEQENVISLYVDNEEKAEALTQLLPSARTYGNVTVSVRVVPANQLAENRLALFQAAFKGNPAFSFAKTVEGDLGLKISFVVFAPKVVQYYQDNLQDINGFRSTLYQEIAADVFEEEDGVFFCTDKA